MVDPVKYYNLEQYLFEDVHQRFHRDRTISAFDFFSIVVWKANRAKSKIARKLLTKDPTGSQSLDTIVRSLTEALYNAHNAKERLHILIDQWGFALPMATAILSVFWPEEFTVYDYRVCDQLGKFHYLYYRTNFDRLWEGYTEFVTCVHAAVPGNLSLRDKDRYLWGKSASEQLVNDIQELFQRATEDTGGLNTKLG